MHRTAASSEAHDALCEALANCLTNADYNERRGVVFLWKEDGSNISSFIPSQPEGINEGIKLSDNERAVLEVIASDPSITTSSIRSETNLSESTVYRTVCGLREKGVLRRIGSKKSGKWEITLR